MTIINQNERKTKNTNLKKKIVQTKTTHKTRQVLNPVVVGTMFSVLKVL